MFDRCLYFNTMALARSVEKAWLKAFRQFNLTPPQAFCLRAVMARSPLRPSELAELLGIARATATRLLDQLERKRLVLRQTQSSDNRELLIVPTKKALAQRTAIERASAAMTVKMKTVLGEQEFERIVETLGSVRNSLL